MQKSKNQNKKNNRCMCGGLIVLERCLGDRWLRCTSCNKEVHFIS